MQPGFPVDVPYKSLPELADDAARKFGDAPLWISMDDGTRISHAEFARLTIECAQALRERGVTHGTHVAVMLPAVPAYPIHWFALARLGAVMVPVNMQLKSHDLDYVLRDSEAEFLVDEEGMRALSLRNRHSSEGWNPSSTADTLMSIQYTSGSTGFPKGCMLTQDYWLVLGLVRAYQGPTPKRLLIDKPFSYMGGMWRFLVCLYLGSAAVVARRFSLSALQDRLVEFDIDYFGATDAVAKLPDHPGLAKLHMAWISIAGLSGGLHAELERKFRAPVRELYGLTETGSTLYMPTDAEHMVGSGSCGIPAPFRECRVMRPDGTEAARGEVGELWVRGRAILKGYYNKPEATREAFSGGWFRTGDLFRQDENGYFYIQGRIKDSIRRSGENISAREIETVASGIEGVLETAAVAVPDELRGEEVKLCVVLQPGRTREEVTPERVASYCAERLAAFKVPRYVEYLEEFPRTSSNKIAKQVLAKTRAGATFDRVAKGWL